MSMSLPLNNNFDISIVTPVFNEEDNIIPLYNAVERAVPSRYSWEIIFVDDGSTDNSAEKILQLSQKHSHVKGIVFSRNYGHQIALTAGIDHAHGRAVITMDSDLQHPPESIKDLLKEWEEGCQIVLAVRQNVQEWRSFKHTASKLFYVLLKKISYVDITDGAADFRLLDKKVVKVLRKYQEKDRFLRGMINDLGFKRKIIYYQEDPRRQGVVKYNLAKMLRLGITGVISFSSFPLRVCSVAGFVISFLSILYAIVIVLDKFINGATPGIASILVGVFFIGGVQLFFIGVLGEYLMTIFREVKARPLYNIMETYPPLKEE